MSEINELRKQIGDLRVDVARVEEKVSSQGDSIDAMRGELRPIVLLVSKWKTWMSMVALVAGAIGSGMREIADWFKGV